MGYSTDFFDSFTLDKPLEPAHAAYLKRFCDSRRMRRNAAIAATFADPLREAVGLPIGEEGGYYVGTDEGDKEFFAPGDPRHVRDDPDNKWAAAFNKPSGFEACAGQRHDASILDFNSPPAGQPGLWCRWTPDDSPGNNGTQIVWDESEKFYDYVEWLEYIIKHFLAPWGYVLDGQVGWRGEDSDDRGVIHVKANRVQAIPDSIMSPEPVWE